MENKVANFDTCLSIISSDPYCKEHLSNQFIMLIYLIALDKIKEALSKTIKILKPFNLTFFSYNFKSDDNINSLLWFILYLDKIIYQKKLKKRN